MFGIRRNDISFEIRKEYNHKNPRIYVKKGDEEYLVGRFLDEKSAELFKETVDYICFRKGE